MATLENNPMFKHASGKLGGFVIRRSARGKSIIARRPDFSNVKPTRAQENVKNRFVEATRYAKEQIQDPIRREEYEKGITSKKRSAYNVAMSDYLNAPVIHDVLITKDQVLIKATDDFMVVGVKVSVHDHNGSLIEKGEALPNWDGQTWQYTFCDRDLIQPGDTIHVFAFDKPGNMTSREEKIE